MDYYNISPNSIQNALYLLLEEGYIFSMERKGYFIYDIENLIIHNFKIENKIQQEEKKIKYDFSYSVVDAKSLAKTIFKRITKDVYDEKNDDLLFQGHIQGDLLLRKSICEYLVIKLNKKINEKIFLKECLEKFIQLYSLAEYYLEKIYNETSSFLLGYANLTNKKIEEGVLLLLQILKKYYI